MPIIKITIMVEREMTLDDHKNEVSTFKLQRLAHSDDATPEMLADLAVNDKPSVRSGVAQNPACPVAQLDQLAQEKHDFIRESVARNKSCPPYILQKLATDPAIEVRIFVTSNPNTPVETLLQLAFCDPRKTVKAASRDALKLKTAEYWSSKVKEGLSLASHDEHWGGGSLGDTLLEEKGLAEVYQSIQAAELNHRIGMATSNVPTDDIAVPHSSGKLRM